MCVFSIYVTKKVILSNKPLRILESCHISESIFISNMQIENQNSFTKTQSLIWKQVLKSYYSSLYQASRHLKNKKETKGDIRILPDSITTHLRSETDKTNGSKLRSSRKQQLSHSSKKKSKWNWNLDMYDERQQIQSTYIR